MRLCCPYCGWTLREALGSVDGWDWECTVCRSFWNAGDVERCPENWLVIARKDEG